MMGATHSFLRPLAELREEDSGATIVEFAFVAPILVLVVIGLFDLGHTQYTSVLMNGAMQQAGRELTLEKAYSSQAEADAIVLEQVRNVVPASAQISLEKKSYTDFDDIGEPEEFTDDNGDGLCNEGEPFVDTNSNGRWDADRGEDGLGSARDALVYTVTVSYDRMFPMNSIAGFPEKVELSASNVLRIQPYDVQTIDQTVLSCV